MKADDYIERVADPLIELLAIKLYEHDNSRTRVPVYNWCSLCNEDREIYRKIAQGEEDLGTVPEELRYGG